MLACLRSTQFIYPDKSGSIYVELRRHNKEFIVTQRIPRLRIMHSVRKGTLNEARSIWLETIHRYEDSGMKRKDLLISGFHEES